MQRIRILISLFVLMAIFVPGGAQASGQEPLEPQPAPVSDLPNYLAYLAWQLRAKHMDESGEITGKIEKAVLDHMQKWLEADSSRAQSIPARRELERIFYNLKYPTGAKPSCFHRSWKGSTLLGVGYSLSWTHFNRANVLALFEVNAGKVRLAAVTHFVPMVDLRYKFHPPVGSDDFWFFVWGMRPGKSQQRLSTVLYTFNGETLKSLWEIRDVYDGKLNVGEKKVTLKYLDEKEYIQEQIYNRKPPRHLATYIIHPDRLELESDIEIPF